MAGYIEVIKVYLLFKTCTVRARIATTLALFCGAGSFQLKVDNKQATLWVERVAALLMNQEMWLRMWLSYDHWSRNISLGGGMCRVGGKHYTIVKLFDDVSALRLRRCVRGGVIWDIGSRLSCVPSDISRINFSCTGIAGRNHPESRSWTRVSMSSSSGSRAQPWVEPMRHSMGLEPMVRVAISLTGSTNWRSLLVELVVKLVRVPQKL